MTRLNAPTEMLQSLSVTSTTTRLQGSLHRSESVDVWMTNTHSIYVNNSENEVTELSENDIDFGAMVLPINKKQEEHVTLVTSEWVNATAHIDGNYNNNLNAYSYGVLVASQGARIELSGRGSDPEFAKHGQLPGESLAAVSAMSFCVRFGIHHLELLYEFQHLAQWSMGERETQMPVTNKYKAYYDSIQDVLSVNFTKVTANSYGTGIHRAEQLAKAALRAPDDFALKIGPALVGAEGWGTEGRGTEGWGTEGRGTTFIDGDDASEMIGDALAESAESQGIDQVCPRIGAESRSPESQVTASPLSAVFQLDVQRVAMILMRSAPVNVFLVSDSRYMLDKLVAEFEVSSRLPDSLLHGWTIRNMGSQVQPEHDEFMSGQQTVACMDWGTYRSMDRSQMSDASRWAFTISQTEYLKLYRENPTITRLIIPVHLREPDLDTLKLIARDEADRLGRIHQIAYPQAALDEALRLVANGQSSAADRMIALLDSTGGAQRARGFDTVTAADITATHNVIQGRTPTPQSVNIEQRLAEHVMGQPDAVHAAARAVSTARLYQGTTHRPLASLLLTGPTGTGKTLIATRLAVELYGSQDRLIRFDMSEYKDDRDAQLRLIGGSTIWKNSDGEGGLTRALRRMPDAVYLFDELEKAHPTIQDLFLQMLDEGRVTSGAGVTLSLDQSVLVFTTNAGVDTQMHGGFSSDPLSGESHVDPTLLQQHFAPEFLNRFDEVITFNPLTSEALASISRHKLDEFVDMVAAQGITLTYDDEVPEALAQLGNEPGMGARPLDRAIRRTIAAPLMQLRDANPNPKAAHIKIVLTSGGIEVVPAE